jgi:hypothetical protein
VDLLDIVGRATANDDSGPRRYFHDRAAYVAPFFRATPFLSP